jgi:hypothetical protein
LAARPRPSEFTSHLLFWILLGVWFLFLLASVSLTNGKDPFIACLFSAYALHQVGKYLAAVEATRQLSEDRHSGALELLLVTPLKESQIKSGHSAAFGIRLRSFKILLLLVNFGMCLAAWFCPKQLSMDGKEQAIFTELFVGGSLTLFADFWAFGKVGVPMALRAKRHQRAVLATWLRVLTVPWVVIFLFIFLMINFKGVVSESTLSGIFALWFALGLFTSFLAGAHASASFPYGLRMFVSEGREGSISSAFQMSVIAS